MRAVFGEKGDFESWIELVKLVSGNFPGLDLKCYKDVLIEKIENNKDNNQKYMASAAK